MSSRRLLIEGCIHRRYGLGPMVPRGKWFERKGRRKDWNDCGGRGERSNGEKGREHSVDVGDMTYGARRPPDRGREQQLP